MHPIHRPIFVLAACGLLAGAWAQAPQEHAAPIWSAGDRWVYAITVGSADTCTRTLHTGSELAVKVLAVDAEGVDIERTLDGTVTQVRMAPNFTTLVKVDAEEILANTYGFALPPGQTWATGNLVASASGTVKYELRCERQPMQKLAVPAGEFDVVPIVCKGKWTNLSSRRSDQITSKYWYAPALRNHVRTTSYSYYEGRTCMDLTWDLKPQPK